MPVESPHLPRPLSPHMQSVQTPCASFSYPLTLPHLASQLILSLCRGMCSARRVLLHPMNALAQQAALAVSSSSVTIAYIVNTSLWFRNDGSDQKDRCIGICIPSSHTHATALEPPLPSVLQHGLSSTMGFPSSIAPRVHYPSLPSYVLLLCFLWHLFLTFHLQISAMREMPILSLFVSTFPH